MVQIRLSIAFSCVATTQILMLPAFAEGAELTEFSPPTHEFSVVLPADVMAVPSDNLHSGITYSAKQGTQSYSVSSSKLFNDGKTIDQFTQEALQNLGAAPTATMNATGAGWSGKAFGVHTVGGDATYVIAVADRGDRDGKVVYEFSAPAPLETAGGKNFVKSIVIYPDRAIHAHLRDLRPGASKLSQVNFWIEVLLSVALCALGLWFGFFKLSGKPVKSASTQGA